MFLTTARLTQYYAELMSKTGIPVLEIHSRKSQAQVRACTSSPRPGTVMRCKEHQELPLYCTEL